jgi:hypothetical protein
VTLFTAGVAVVAKDWPVVPVFTAAQAVVLVEQMVPPRAGEVAQVVDLAPETAPQAEWLLLVGKEI